MKTAALIPARMGSTRFPAKMMADLGGKPVILRTYEAARETGLFDTVLVVTDHPDIHAVIVDNGGEAVMSSPDHPSGSDRIAEASRDRDFDIIVNVQGDEPFMQKKPLASLLSAFNDPAVDVASLMQRLSEVDAKSNRNIVKVVVDLSGDAMYFSREAIPYNMARAGGLHHFRHIGVYAYRREALLRFTSYPVSPLEFIEKIEALRMLENGMRIRMVICDYVGIGIDTEEDLEKARHYLSVHNPG